MRFANAFTILLLSLITTSACNTDLDLPVNKETQKKIVLLGELVANEHVLFRAGQSLPLSSNSTYHFELPTGLEIKINDLAGNTTALVGKEDDLSAKTFTIPYTAAYKIEAGNTYDVAASNDALGTATANVTVPRAFTAIYIAKEDVQYGTEPAIRFDIQLNDSDGETYYMIECLKQQAETNGPDTIYNNSFSRQYLYTKDAQTDNLIENNGTSGSKRIFLSDRGFRNSSHTTQVYMRKDQSDPILVGRILLLVKSVSKDYYYYAKQLESINSGSYITTQLNPNIKGNVQGGLGMIGGVYEQEFSFFFYNSGF